MAVVFQNNSNVYTNHALRITCFYRRGFSLNRHKWTSFVWVSPSLVWWADCRSSTNGWRVFLSAPTTNTGIPMNVRIWGTSSPRLHRTEVCYLQRI